MGEGAEEFQVRVQNTEPPCVSMRSSPDGPARMLTHGGSVPMRAARTLAGLRQPTSTPWNSTGPAWAEGACRGMFG